MSDHATAYTNIFQPRMSVRFRFSAVRHLALMMDAWRTRRILAELDPRLLKDIGVSRGEARTEAARRVWDFAPRQR